MNNNICHFVPYNKDYHSLHTINYVLETKNRDFSGLATQSMYKMHLVYTGKGILHTLGKKTELTAGDVFFTFPGMPCAIESLENFTYMYISFLGSRGNMIMDKLKISAQNYYFPQCTEIVDYWYKGLECRSETIDLMAESVLLYSFCYLAERTISTEEKKEKNTDVALLIKKYADDNLSNSELTLKMVSEELSYSPKYISFVFKKRFNVGFSEYLNTVRIQNACTIMKQGFTGMADVSNQCGFSDPQYFSKVFKQKMGISPREYVNTIKE